MWVWDGRREGGKGGGRLRAVFCEKGDVRTKKGWILRLVSMYVYMVGREVFLIVDFILVMCACS